MASVLSMLVLFKAALWVVGFFVACAIGGVIAAICLSGSIYEDDEHD